MKPPKKERTLSRLAANEAASAAAAIISSHATGDELEARLRIWEDLQVPANRVNTVYNNMIDHLQQADLTINFNVGSLFNLKGKYINSWEKPISHTDNYHQKRNRIEERLFNYGNAGHNATDDIPIGTSTRMRLFGSRNSNPFFIAGMRPKYGALNFANFGDGPASCYGKSYFVLKDYMKHNCTFFWYDTIIVDQIPRAAEGLANYFNMHRLIIGLNDKMLRALHNAVNGIATAQGSFDDLEYIEAQMHSDVVFKRDVKEIHVSNADLSQTGNNAEKIRNKLTDFSQKNHIRLYFH